MITFTLSAPTLSPNELKRRDRFSYRAYRRSLAWEVNCAFIYERARLPLKRAHIRVERHSSGMLDTDNLYGSLKPLLDVLQPASKRCPDGLGIIANDSPAALTIEASQLVCKRGMGKTVVTIREIKEASVGQN